jgi:hypothetical protein
MCTNEGLERTKNKAGPVILKLLFEHRTHMTSFLSIMKTKFPYKRKSEICCRKKIDIVQPS